jgi:hypothetical protein
LGFGVFREAVQELLRVAQKLLRCLEPLVNFDFGLLKFNPENFDKGERIDRALPKEKIKKKIDKNDTNFTKYF